jgi:glyoxylase-like metal-dependent hydrolase (beta-lactamase superfamily II)
MNDFYILNLGITNAYLLPCNDGYLLIDTGYTKDFNKFKNQLRTIKIDLSQIKYVLLTHHHDDHVGFASKLVEQIGCKIIVHKEAIQPLSKGESADSMTPLNKRIKLVLTIFERFHKNFNYPPVNITENDIVITSDKSDILDRIGVKGKILYTPGHTIDSISMVLNNGKAFVGDVAMNFLKFCGTKYRPIYIENISQVYESWKKLKKAGAKEIYPAHGRAFSIAKLAKK